MTVAAITVPELQSSTHPIPAPELTRFDGIVSGKQTSPSSTCVALFGCINICHTVTAMAPGLTFANQPGPDILAA